MAGAQIAAKERQLCRLRHVDARILQERCEIVAGGPHHRVLKIEHAEPGGLAALRQPQQVGRVEVTQDPGVRELLTRLAKS